jgi:hypothetical protein
MASLGNEIRYFVIQKSSIQAAPSMANAAAYRQVQCLQWIESRPYANGGNGEKAIRNQPGLFPRLPPDGQGFRPIHEGGNIPLIQFTVEAKTHKVPVLPPDHGRTADCATVQYHRCPGGETGRAIQLRTAGREIEDMDKVTLTIGLKERR